MVAGEVSGDVLGAGLIRALRDLYPQAEFFGVGGTGMTSAGLVSLFPLERLSVMGLLEVLVRLPELLRLRRGLLRTLFDDPPDLYIGIDAPDFNLPVEERLKARGIPTVHYVSPTVWAWRPGRVHKIRRAADLVLTLFPFESRFLRQHDIPSCTVGHPLADEIGDGIDRLQARVELQLNPDQPVLALLPGSRSGELERLARDLLETALWLVRKYPDLQIVVPCATTAIRGRIGELASRFAPGLTLRLLDGQSRTAMAASNAILLASGTATLEAALLDRPMVVVYRVNPVTFWLAKRLVKVSHVALPNLLSGRRLVPEFLQGEVKAELLGPALQQWLDPEAWDRHPQMQQAFARIRSELRRDANRSAAAAVSRMLG